ncbi:DUF924 family protein [Roseomonas gilardii]|uniref:DUF924 family protein n=1 Tax=Roseomonas gilardii TaxID=257708 RepID=UPI000483451B|nr:DUF924 family protein [Roseomonas gilardii]SUE63013.1 Uncharacterized protein conserved in bacteria [Roseomonas gilardii subsp. rosea]
MNDEHAESVLAFWREAGPGRWFAKDDGFDAACRHRFGDLHLEASRGPVASWIGSPDTALAFILLTDQIPRNLYRGSAHAFATDPLALAAARLAIAHGHDEATEPALRPFLYLPFEHSEDPRDQARSLQLFAQHAERSGDTHSLHWARLHADIIRRFGRFPHRNAALGRETTPEEKAFLDAGGFSG